MISEADENYTSIEQFSSQINLNSSDQINEQNTSKLKSSKNSINQSITPKQFQDSKIGIQSNRNTTLFFEQEPQISSNRQQFNIKSFDEIKDTQIKQTSKSKTKQQSIVQSRASINKSPVNQSMKQIQISQATQRLYVDNFTKQQKIEEMKQRGIERELSNLVPAKMNQKSVELVNQKKVQPIQERYKYIIEVKERKRKQLELVMAYENAMKDPENINPQFKPDLSESQGVVNKQYDGGFDGFLKEMNRWKTKRDKKINDLKRENLESQGLSFRPEINQVSKQILEIKTAEKTQKLNQSKSQILSIKNNSVIASCHQSQIQDGALFTNLPNPIEQLQQNKVKQKRNLSTSQDLRRSQSRNQSTSRSLQKLNQSQSMNFQLSNVLQSQSLNPTQNLSILSSLDEEEKRIREKAAQFVEKLTKSIIEQTKESLGEEVKHFQEVKDVELNQDLKALEEGFLKLLDEQIDKNHVPEKIVEQIHPQKLSNHSSQVDVINQNQRQPQRINQKLDIAEQLKQKFTKRDRSISQNYQDPSNIQTKKLDQLKQRYSARNQLNNIKKDSNQSIKINENEKTISQNKSKRVSSNLSTQYK